MKKALLAVYIILLLIAVKLTGTFVLNEYLISKYSQGDYNPKGFQSLFALNYPEPYIAHYNYGNTLYHNSEFDGAIYEYQKALEQNPPADKEEDIRINLALAMLKKIERENEKTGEDEKTNGEETEKKDYDALMEEIEAILDLLKNIKDVLPDQSQDSAEVLQAIENTEQEWAQEKQNLEEERAAEKERQENGEQEEEPQETGQEEGARDSTQEVEEKLDGIKQESGAFRDDYLEALNGSSRRGYNPYDGKKW